MSRPNAQSTIEVTLVGLIATFVDPTNEKCTVGVLRETPGGHGLHITVNKLDADGNPQPFATIEEADVADNLQIAVTNNSWQGISRREIPIDRIAGANGLNNESFRWVVDFESDLYPKAIGAKRAGFNPVLTLNSGELVTRKLSDNQLIIKRGPNGPKQIFGTVAVKTGIDIVLDQPNSRAVFTNGDKVVFKADNQSSFQITIARVCNSQAGGSDADSYYTALGASIPDDEKIFFSSTPLPAGVLSPPGSPDAACFSGHVGISQPTE
ncbi:MAG TPA: hypothetical protein VGN86_06240 [Pyrinomonadaceae bacterium]|nr:hypothetical protein [Pyrinomonadaceae bacterium]